MNDRQNSTKIRELNDRLRCHHTGGRVVVTAGIDALGPENVLHIVREVAAFDAFTPDNDPYGEHDCATLTVDGHLIIWKIDLYEDDPVNGKNRSSIARRVLTIMLADEY